MTKQKRPKVSIIIPTYNRADLIVETLESVLNQTYRDFEVIVVDDGSTDDTPAVLQKYLDRITYVKQERQGQPSATNAGIELAKGEYVAFLDSDDLWLPGKLEKQVKFLDEHPEYAMLTGNGVYVDNEKKLLVPNKRARMFDKNGISLRDIYLKSSIMTSTMIARREIFDAIGGLDPELKSSIHLDLAFRVLVRYRVAFLNDVLIRLRRHGGERISTNEERRQIYNLKVIRKLLAHHPEAIALIGGKNINRRIAYRYYRLAKLYLKQHEREKAQECFRRTSQYRPDSAKYLFYRMRTDFGAIGKNACDAPEAGDFVEMLKDGFAFRVRRDWICPSFLKWLSEETNISGVNYDSTSRHARNRKVDVLLEEKAQTLFVKRFFSPRVSYSVKDFFRPSKAIKAWKATLMLSRFGFRCAPVVLVGEKRTIGFLADAILITDEVSAPTVSEYVSQRFAHNFTREALSRKRTLIRSLGKEVGRMHLLGIVHGDLLPGNILVNESQGEAAFVFLDNDRTRRLLRALPEKLVVRNLVQLGRFLLPGITLADRLRFFKAYLEENPRFRGREKQLLTRIIERTRERVIKIERLGDKAAATLSFRALMSGKRPG